MYRWDLGAFYGGFASPAFQEDCEKLFQITDALLAYFEDREAQADKKGYLENLLKKQEELNILSSRVFGFIHLNMSADTQNPEAKQAYVKMQALSGKFALIDTKFKTHLSTLEDLEGLVEDSPYLRKYAFLLAEAKEEIAHTLSADLEYLASELRQNGSSLWSQLQRHMTSMAEIDFRGKKLSLTEIRNLAYSSDPEERKEAYFKELEIYEKIEDAVAFALAGIKGEVNTMVKHRKFASPLDEALFNSRMKKETLDALLEAMKESLPVFRKYLRHKAKLLGHENGLPWYDLFAPLGKSEKKYTVEEAQEFILRQFGSFSEDLRNLAERAFRNNWIDYLPRKGKVGGAFCSNNLALKESRILTNFGGEIGDVITIAHELGHAYHGEQIFKEAPLNSHYTMPVAETASNLCETIVKRAAYREAESRAEKINILETDLQDSTQVIVDIYSRYLFETAAFEARKTSLPSAKDFNRMMIEAQKESYGDGLDPEFLNPGMWICKSHYYSGGLSFYNFPYAFGLLFAKGIYAKYLEEGSTFVPKLDTLLRATGKMKVEDVASVVGIDLTDPSFWRKGLEKIGEDIEEFIRLTTEK